MSICDGATSLLLEYSSQTIGPSSDNIWQHNATNFTETMFSHWCRYPAPPKYVHIVIGITLLLVGIAGTCGNALVILVFTRYRRRLRTQSTTLIVNLAVSDFLMSCLHPMASYSSFQGVWQFGKHGCEFYAGFCGLFELASIVTLAAIAMERCFVIAIKSWHNKYRMKGSTLHFTLVFIWFYCSCCVIPPFFGWGAYRPEGFLTSCTFDYVTTSASNRGYFFYLLILGFVIPLSVIVACYSAIIQTVRHHENEIQKIRMKRLSNKTLPYKRSDYKTEEIVLLVIGLFLMSWTPYAMMTTFAQFGGEELVPPWASTISTVFAKMSTMYNPIVYGISNRHFRASMRHLLCKNGSSQFADKTCSNRPKRSTLKEPIETKSTVKYDNGNTCCCTEADSDGNAESLIKKRCCVVISLPEPKLILNPEISASETPTVEVPEIRDKTDLHACKLKRSLSCNYDYDAFCNKTRKLENSQTVTKFQNNLKFNGNGYKLHGIVCKERNRRVMLLEKAAST